MMRFLCLLAVLLMCLPGFSAQADILVRSVYQTTYLGLPVSRAHIHLTLSKEGYNFTGKGEASVLAGLFKPMTASLAAKGKLTDHMVKPESFTAKLVGQKDVYDIVLGFDEANVTQETSLPKRENMPPDFVPVTPAMKKGVIDPLAAFIIPIKSNAGLDDVCHRTLPIYTGRERFDLVLSPARQEQVAIPGLYQGQAFVCAGRYLPIGGHRAQKAEVKYMIDNRAMEAWFVPLPGGQAMGLYKVTVGTKFGTVKVELEKADIVNTSAQTTPAPASQKKL